jgi:hypothetical protein
MTATFRKDKQLQLLSSRSIIYILNHCLLKTNDMSRYSIIDPHTLLDQLRCVFIVTQLPEGIHKQTNSIYSLYPL